METADTKNEKIKLDKSVYIGGDATGSNIRVVGVVNQNFQSAPVRETPPILTYLIDRVQHIIELKEFTYGHLKNDAPKPLFCIMPGTDDAAHYSLAERYAKLEFPELLSGLGKTKQIPDIIPLVWPDREMKHDKGLAYLRSTLINKVSGFSAGDVKLEILRNKLDEGGKHLFLFYEISPDRWNNDTNKLINSWIEELSKLPQSYNNIVVIVFLYFVYEPVKSFRKTPQMKESVNELRNCDRDNVLCLNEPSLVTKIDVRDWAKLVASKEYTKYLGEGETINVEHLIIEAEEKIFTFSLDTRSRAVGRVIKHLDEAIKDCRRHSNGNGAFA